MDEITLSQVQSSSFIDNAVAKYGVIDLVADFDGGPEHYQGMPVPSIAWYSTADCLIMVGDSYWTAVDYYEREGGTLPETFYYVFTYSKDGLYTLLGRAGPSAYYSLLASFFDGEYLYVCGYHGGTSRISMYSFSEGIPSLYAEYSHIGSEFYGIAAKDNFIYVTCQDGLRVLSHQNGVISFQNLFTHSLYEESGDHGCTYKSKVLGNMVLFYIYPVGLVFFNISGTTVSVAKIIGGVGGLSLALNQQFIAYTLYTSGSFFIHVYNPENDSEVSVSSGFPWHAEEGGIFPDFVFFINGFVVAIMLHTLDYNEDVHLEGINIYNAESFVLLYSFTNIDYLDISNGCIEDNKLIADDSNAIGYSSWINFVSDCTFDGLQIVIYHGNGSDGGDVPATVNHREGTTVTVLDAGTMTRSGFDFSGWNTAENGSGTSYNPSDTFTMGSSNVILYAQWSVTAINYRGVKIPMITDYDDDGDGIPNILDFPVEALLTIKRKSVQQINGIPAYPGDWPHDPNLGSNLYEIKTITDQSVKLAENFAVAALSPLVKSGLAKRVTAAARRDIKADRIRIDIQIQTGSGTSISYTYFHEVG